MWNLVTWLIHMWDMTHSLFWQYVLHVIALLVPVSRGLKGGWHNSLIYIYVESRDLTHSFVWHDASISWTWLVRTWDMTRCYVSGILRNDSLISLTICFTSFCCSRSLERHDAFICGTWLLRTWDMTHSLVWQYVQHRCAACACLFFIHLQDVTHLYAGHDSFIRGTWLISYFDNIFDAVALLVPVSRGLKGAWHDSLISVESFIRL